MDQKVYISVKTSICYNGAYERKVWLYKNADFDMLNFLITNTDLEEIILGATVSSTTAEYSRSTMVEDRLDDLSLMHIHRDHQIDLDRIITVCC